MKTRKITLFKINNEVIIEERKELTPAEIEAMKWIIAEETDVAIFEVEVDYLEVPEDVSNIDLTTDGLLDWTDAYFRTIIGVKLTIEIGGDIYLDAVLNNTLDEHLEFLKEN